MLKHVEVVFAAEGALVPRHRPLQRVHRIGRALLAAVLDIDAERDAPPRHGDEGVGDVGEIAGDDGEEIAGLLERIAPHRPVTAALRFAGAFEIAVGEQHRRLGLVRLQPHAIGREHVGPVRKVGDAAEAFGLALGAIGGAGAVEAHQLGVGGRIEPRLQAQRERPARRVGQRKFGRRGLVGAGGERRAVEGGRDELEFVAIELQRGVGPALRVGPQGERGDDARRLAIERNIEIDRIDQELGDAIVFEANGLTLSGAHSDGLSLVSATPPGSVGRGALRRRGSGQAKAAQGFSQRLGGRSSAGEESRERPAGFAGRPADAHERVDAAGDRRRRIDEGDRPRRQGARND